MGLFKNNKKLGIFADVIRCDEPTYLIWKWHPDGTILGENKREYAIRYGSKLRVKDGEVAVFVYKQNDGKMQDFILGPYDETIKTKNFPVLTSILGSFFGGDTPFQAEVFFINLAHIVQTKFVIPYFDIYDPRYPDFSVPVAVRGTITFSITDFKQFIKLHRLDNFDLSTFQNQIKDTINRYVKNEVANASITHNIPVVQIETKTAIINNIIENTIKNRLSNDFGITVSGVDINAIEINKDSEEYLRLLKITKCAQEEIIAMDLEHRKESLSIQREEGKYAMHKQTQSANIGAFQIEKQTEVGIAGAEALGKMGEKGAGNISIGGDGNTGFNPASMMASIAVGGIVGQNIANTMNNAINGTNITNITVPPIPSIKYNVVKNGNSFGPFDKNKLKEMAINGELFPDNLVWTPGLSEWKKANSIEDLQDIFPPPIPHNK